MGQIEPILKRISILYYIFVGLFMCGTIYGFVVGIMSGMANTAPLPVEMSTADKFAMIFLALMMVVVGIVAIVLFVMLLVSIGKSIAQKNIFSLQTVSLIKKYAIFEFIMIILMVILDVFFDYSNEGAEAAIYRYGSLISSISSLIMLLMFAQVLKIGHLLKQEQDLTI